ncbi:flavin reductase family protein [Arthrobacter sp. GCM10027362]|uniref:flavin reductase family protein n=1 Tax=Arthrobacter sp. GCM10027362 TaxID=3273379 RepID=UPI003642C010
MGRILDRFVDGLDYPMFIVTAAGGAPGGEAARSGCLVGFATQCSIEPERLLVCISKKNHTHRLARTARALGVHVPDAGQRGLAELFGGSTGDELDKFARCRWRDGPAGVPILTDCPRWLVGEVLERIDLGDHTGFVLAPLEGASAGGTALSFSDVADLQAGHEA